MLTDPAHMLVTAAQPANVDTVIVDGRVLKRAGELTTIDLPQVRERRPAGPGRAAGPGGRLRRLGPRPARLPKNHYL